MLSSYFNITSDIHSLNPAYKILDLIIFLLAILLVKNPYILCVIIIFELLLVLSTNVPIIYYLKTIYSLKILIIFILVINILSKISIYQTIITIISLIIIVIYSNLLVFTTTPIDINKGLSNLLKPLEKLGINISILSLIISLAISFIPNLLIQGKKILNNIRLRNINNKMYKLKSLVIPLFLITLQKGDMIADVMLLKNFDCNKKIYYQLNKSYIDYLLLFIHVIILIIALVG